MKKNIIIGITLLLFAFIASCQNDENVEFNRYYSAGSLIYRNHCQNCHGTHGEGLQNLIPPLTDSIYLKINKNLLPCSIKYGLKGKFTIDNRSFEGQMPANDLAPMDIAKVLTYITNSFGNKMQIINIEDVNNNLNNCK